MVEMKDLPVAPPWLAAKGKPFCLLCGNPTAMVCIYRPGKLSPIAHPTDGVRLIFYSLCSDCGQRREQLKMAIEAVLDRDVMATLKQIQRSGAFQLKPQSHEAKRRSRQHRRRHRGSFRRW